MTLEPKTKGAGRLTGSAERILVRPADERLKSPFDGSVERSVQPTSAVDPALVIGLAIAMGRRGGLTAVPDPVLTRLTGAAISGCGACRMVVEWLERRGGNRSGQSGVQNWELDVTLDRQSVQGLAPADRVHNVGANTAGNDTDTIDAPMAPVRNTGGRDE